MLVSGLANEGLGRHVGAHRRSSTKTTKAGEFDARRRAQQVKWMWAMLEERLLSQLRTDPAVRKRLPALEAAVAEGALSRRRSPSTKSPPCWASDMPTPFVTAFGAFLARRTRASRR